MRNGNRVDRRLPQPECDSGRDLAESIWKRRHEIGVATIGTMPSRSVDIRVTPALELHIHDGCDDQLIWASRSGRDESGTTYVSSRNGTPFVSSIKERWITHAWRAAQAARLLTSLGIDDRLPAGTPICVSSRRPRGPFARALQACMPARPATASEILERRLDDEVARRIEAMPIESPTSYVLEIGNGVVIDAASFEPLLAVSHPEHGTLSLPGRAAAGLNRRMDEMRLRACAMLPNGGGLENARISRILHLCTEAVSIDPEMTDAAGTPLRPLLEEHLPRLAQRHREAIHASTPEERSRIDDEVAIALESIVPAIEQGMATVARTRRDALRTELRFLSFRHPATSDDTE